MLYVKVDANGNPTEVAKNFRQIKEEYTSKNTAIPDEGGFSENLSNFGYALVPESEPLPPKSGSKVVPDVPTKNDDGTMTRTWKYEALSESEISFYSQVMRTKRKNILINTVDRISPIRWELFTDAEKQEIKDWHQKMLDLPQEEGWPYITFPQKPSILD